MEEGYYIPEIEEICVGFIFDHDNGKSWDKGLVYGAGMTVTISDISQDIKDGAIRVKSLDRKDIESCGFEFDLIRSRVEGNFSGEYKKDRKIILEYSPYRLMKGGTERIPNTTLRIWRRVEPEETMNGFPYCARMLFDGIIRNKSELRKALQQVIPPTKE